MTELSTPPPPLPKPRPDKRRPDLDSLFSVNPDGSHNVIHPADVRGVFSRLKHFLWPVLIGLYVAMPWVKIGGNPAILIDIPRRHFYLFGNTYTAQDFWLAFFWVSGIGFTLFMVSALFGRLWCGYGCPHTVFLEGVYRRIERWIEGPGHRRQVLDKAPWNANKIVRRGGKYLIFAVISAVLSHTFLGYFMPAEEVLAAVTGPPGEHWVAFVFVLVFTIVIFVNFAWFREQLCIVICPYGRLQGVLYDEHTINVGYDKARGEPRGKLGTGEDKGHCVDCFRCVAVCPTGIDIRNGTQLECVGCANCIDACDEVMDKLELPRGLVRYDSQAGLEGEARRFVRPRLALYGVLLVLGITAFTIAASTRQSVEVKLLRLQTSPFTLGGGLVTNSFSLYLENKTPAAATFRVEIVGEAEEAKGEPGQRIEYVLPMRRVEIASLADQRIPVFVRIPEQLFHPGMRIHLKVHVEDTGEVFTVDRPLLGPMGQSAEQK